MASRMVELGATGLVELGATQLVELGSYRYRSGVAGLSAVELVELGHLYKFLGEAGLDSEDSPVLDIFKFVEAMENPALLQDHDPDAKEKAIMARLHQISRHNRKVIINATDAELRHYSKTGTRLSGTDHLGYYHSNDTYGWLKQAGELRGLLDEYQYHVADPNSELGKSFFKRAAKAVKRIHKSVAKKVVKVVKSPAFLTVVGVAANFIPVVGQVASVAAFAAAGVMAKKQQAAAAKSGSKKKMERANLMSTIAAIAPGVSGMVGNVVAPAVFGTAPTSGGAPGQINTVGVGNFVGSTVAAVGNAVAVNQAIRGATGSNIAGPAGTILHAVEQNPDPKVQTAIEAGRANLLNNAAATGDLQTMQDWLGMGGLSTGAKVALGLGASALVIAAVYALSSD